jgi:ParB family chromosome partitioning protein
MEKKSRLGRGLDALLSEAPPASESSQVSVDAIEQNPFQPRKGFDEDELSSLSASIRSHGVLQPLVVRQVGDRYQLVAGERRLRAARAAGLAAVPVTVVNFNDQKAHEAALIENIQRSDLNPIEKAHGFKDYLDRYKITHEQLATQLGLARPTITNLVALLDLPAELQDAVRVGQLTTGHAKVLKGITDPARQIQVSKEIIARGLSVHATEAFVKELTASGRREPAGAAENGQGDGKPTAEKTAHVQAVEDELRKKLGVRLEIKVRGKDRGQIVLSFESNDDFERMVEVLRR